MSTHNNFITSTNTVLSHFCNKIIKSDNLLSEYFIDILANQIANSYKVIESNYIQSISDVFSIFTDSFNCDEYADKGLDPLVDIYSRLNKEFDDVFNGFYLHGSMATLDYVSGWSDVDTFAVVSKETLMDKRRLMHLRSAVIEINRIVLKICKFQHHGVMIATEYDLYKYNGNILPYEVFSYMKSMKVGVSTINGALSNDINQKSNRLISVLNFIIDTNEQSIMKSHAYKDEYLLSEYRNSENGMYQFKYYIEQFMLIPALYLSLIGESCYKKYSFDSVKDVFPTDVMEWIKLVSSVRQEWKNHDYDYGRNNIPKWIKEIVPENYFQIGADIANKIKSELL